MIKSFVKYIIILQILLCVCSNQAYSTIYRTVQPVAPAMFNNRSINRVNTYNNLSGNYTIMPGSVSSRAHKMPTPMTVRIQQPVTNSTVNRLGVNNGLSNNSSQHIITGAQARIIPAYPPSYQRYYNPYVYTQTTTYYPLSTVNVNYGNGNSGVFTTQKLYTSPWQNKLQRFLSW